MSGVDAVRGIAYQQAHAVLVALDLLDDEPNAASLRVEGVNDIVDIEVLDPSDSLLYAKQVKGRSEPYTWGEAELVSVMRRWAVLPNATNATFEFVTDGRLGPTGAKVAEALEKGRLGDSTALLALLGEAGDGATCKALLGARVKVDPASTGALLLRAEGQVRSMLISPLNAAEVTEQARQAIDRLYRLMFVRGGDPEASRRVITRHELASTLGVSPSQAVGHRWPGSLRDRYISAAKIANEDFVRPLLRSLDSAEADRIPVQGRDVHLAPGVESLLDLEGPVMLCGRTGTGKSTASYALRKIAAARGQAVLVAHAETYLPGRLAALVADAIASVIREELPFATGRQVLTDKSATLVIDGVSEVPVHIRTGLREDLIALVAAGRGVRTILVGRDLAVLREALPTSVSPRAFTMLEWDKRRRRDLAASALGVAMKTRVSAEDREVLELDAQIEMSLGDAAGNPLIYKMAVELIRDGVAFQDRPTLYRGFLERMSSRSGSTNIVFTAMALGIVFAELLDQGRRYADPYEWAELLAAAVARLPNAAAEFTRDAADQAARRTGLIAPIGYTQTIAPVHDSFGDFFAATAHVRGLAQLPVHLERHDDQRVQFIAELSGVDAALASKLVRDLPFVAARLAQFDRSPIREDGPQSAELLLKLLMPNANCRVLLCRMPDERLIAIRTDRPSAWIDHSAVPPLLNLHRAVVSPPVGLLGLVTRIWREELRSRLALPRLLPAARPQTLAAATNALDHHAKAVAVALEDLIVELAPPRHVSVLRAQLGPIGLAATVLEEVDDGGPDWRVAFQHSDTIAIIVGAAAQNHKRDDKVMGGSSTVHGLLRESAQDVAVHRLRNALNALTTPSWI